MATATVTKRIDIHNPNIEAVQLTATDGEKYLSRKFTRVTIGIASPEESVATVPIVGTTDSTGIVTITWSGVVDKKLNLVLFGSLGN